MVKTNTVQLKCFLAVAEYLNFAKAAEQMNVSQPAITHQIQSLESELNVKLFRRTTRSVEITVEGLAFFDDAKDIVSRSEMAIKRFENTDAQEILDLSIGCTSITQYEMLPDVLQELGKRYPNLHPRICLNASVQLLSRVEEGTIDIAFGLKNSVTKKKSLIYRELKKYPFVCVFKADHPFAQKESLTMEEVKQQKLIHYLPGSAAPAIIQMQSSLAVLKKPAELYFCESAESALILVQAGFGITILPDMLVEERYDLVKRPLLDAGELSFGFYYKTLKGNGPLSDFVGLLKQQEALTKT